MRAKVACALLAGFLMCTPYVIQEKQFGMNTYIHIPSRCILKIDTVCVLGGDPIFGGCVKKVTYLEKK